MNAVESLARKMAQDSGYNPDGDAYLTNSLLQIKDRSIPTSSAVKVWEIFVPFAESAIAGIKDILVTGGSPE